MSKEPLSDVLARMKKLEHQLKEAGVPLEVIPNVMRYIDEYNEIRENLGQARDNQFMGEAYEISETLRGRDGMKRASAYLRQFAERITEHAVVLVRQYGADIHTLVDNIPPKEEESE